ncbi:response regulator [Aquabacterium sp.]|uniref:response regulator n=1 Tax=Aquabacterium sp. TaxID=1872578 RepID=UPI002CF343CF|nr:response regulator transcription factor [Aquabacterium sp.]HSW03980.1 response regulator transcription factor [Aquabacterium sp.]
MIRLLIADDHAAMRHGLRQLFGLVADVLVTAEAADGEQTLNALHSDSFDVVLLDLSMPGLSGVELIERIHARYAELPILVLSMHSETQIVQRALGAGARGYLVKGCDGERIVEAVRCVATGAHWVEQLPLPAPPPPDAWERVLSPFGTRVAQLLDQGLAARDIAQRLGVRIATVRHFVDCVTSAQQTSRAADTLPNEKNGNGGT